MKNTKVSKILVLPPRATPRYLWHRIGVWLYEKRYPDQPWLTRQAVEILESNMPVGGVGIEWGSGRSTVWLAKRLAHLVSVEHNPSWFSDVTKKLATESLTNVDYRLVEVRERAAPLLPAGVGPNQGEGARTFGLKEYYGVAHELPDRSMDLVLVDGCIREQCLLAAIPKVKPGGVLIFDNANWFFPNRTDSPGSVLDGQDPPLPESATALRLLAGWQLTKTSNGVSDTWLWFAPK